MAHLGSCSHTTSSQAETGIQLAFSLRFGCEVSPSGSHRARRVRARAQHDSAQHKPAPLGPQRGSPPGHWCSAGGGEPAEPCPERQPFHARCQAPAVRISADSLALFRRKAALTGVGREDRQRLSGDARGNTLSSLLSSAQSCL